MFDYAHLEALLAVEREGTFEGAARFLGITASAVSQRVKLLEERIGAVVINRQIKSLRKMIGLLFRKITVNLLLKLLLMMIVFPAGLWMCLRQKHRKRRCICLKYP